MDKYELKGILDKIACGQLLPDDAMNMIKLNAYDDLSFAKIDNQRGIRQGANEVIYGEGKTKEQLLKIVKAMLNGADKNVLITRTPSESTDYLKEHGVNVIYDKLSRICIAGEYIKKCDIGKIVIATGGTSDIPVAEEAALTAEFYGSNVVRLYDVGVSGVHRLLDKASLLVDANVVVAIAGMEGALASVIGGLVDCPVIAVPTSVGYGANFGGLSALLSMLNSCASGVSVVNIDNGFGAGYLANMINKK